MLPSILLIVVFPSTVVVVVFAFGAAAVAPSSRARFSPARKSAGQPAKASAQTAPCANGSSRRSTRSAARSHFPLADVSRTRALADSSRIS